MLAVQLAVAQSVILQLKPNILFQVIKSTIILSISRKNSNDATSVPAFDRNARN